VWYPLAVILSLFGVDAEDYPTVLTFSQRLFGAERGEDADQVMVDMLRYFASLVRDRRSDPRDDISSRIANASIDGEPLADLATLGYYTILLTAGHDTTSKAMSVGLECLARNPDQLRALQAEPRLLHNAVDEMIRISSPVRHFMRTAQEDTEIAGVRIAKGDWVYLSYLAANHDPAVFPDALRFDISRSNADQHLAFGFGVHYCLGAQLAKMELRTVFGDLVPRLANLELDGEPTSTAANFISGRKHLPIRFQLER
jgi:cytochrome P450